MIICTLGQVPGRPQGGRHGMVFAFRAAIQSSSSVTVHPPSVSTLAPTLIIGDYRRSPVVRFFVSLSRSIYIGFAFEQSVSCSMPLSSH